MSDGTYLYYAVGGAAAVLKQTVGIYRLSIAELADANAEPQPKKLTGKPARDLAVYGGFLYFSNKDDGSKLYRVSINGGEQVLFYDHKVTETVLSGSKLFFTRGMSLSGGIEGAAVYSLDLANNTEQRISYSKGKYLVPLNGEIYFVNTDMLTSTLFGDGVYKAPQDGSSWIGESFELLSGAQKVLSAGDGDAIYSLTTDGANLYYYRTADKHFYRYNPVTETETDLMDTFVPPEETIVLSFPYGEVKAHAGYLYYTNLLDGGRLHRYDPQNGATTRVTSSMVADFAFNGKYLYYAGLRLTNCDTYRANLITGETERIATDKGLHFAFYGEKIYYMNCNGKNTLNEMNPDGTDDRVVFDAQALSDYDITVRNGKIYFVATFLYCYDPVTDNAQTVSETAKPNEYFILDNTAYLMDDKTKNTLVSVSLSDGTVKTYMDLGTTGDARSFFEYEGNVYAFVKTTKNLKEVTGLYRFNGDAAEIVEIEGFDGRYLNSATVSGDKIYFLDVWFIGNAVPSGSGKLMILDLQTKTVRVA